MLDALEAIDYFEMVDKRANELHNQWPDYLGKVKCINRF